MSFKALRSSFTISGLTHPHCFRFIHDLQSFSELIYGRRLYHLQIDLYLLLLYSLYCTLTTRSFLYYLIRSTPNTNSRGLREQPRWIPFKKIEVFACCSNASWEKTNGRYIWRPPEQTSPQQDWFWSFVDLPQIEKSILRGLGMIGLRIKHVRVIDCLLPYRKAIVFVKIVILRGDILV